MPDRLPETAPAPDFDAKSAAKMLLRSVRAGALATIDRNTGLAPEDIAQATSSLEALNVS